MACVRMHTSERVRERVREWRAVACVACMMCVACMVCMVCVVCMACVEPALPLLLSPLPAARGYRTVLLQHKRLHCSKLAPSGTAAAHGHAELLLCEFAEALVRVAAHEYEKEALAPLSSKVKPDRGPHGCAHRCVCARVRARACGCVCACARSSASAMPGPSALCIRCRLNRCWEVCCREYTQCVPVRNGPLSTTAVFRRSCTGSLPRRSRRTALCASASEHRLPECPLQYPYSTL